MLAPTIQGRYKNNLEDDNPKVCFITRPNQIQKAIYTQNPKLKNANKHTKTNLSVLYIGTPTRAKQRCLQTKKPIEKKVQSWSVKEHMDVFSIQGFLVVENPNLCNM